MVQFREPPRSGVELRWQLFGIRFRVQPYFFLFSAVLAYVLVGWNPLFIVVDVTCIFVAVVFTEFVQGLVYRSYGLRSTVLVGELGGGVYPESEPPYRIQRIVVALASPASSFLLFAIVHYSQQQYHWAKPRDWTNVVYVVLEIISAFWGVMGLIPMIPYPGGRILLEILTFLSPRHGLVWTLGFSLLLGIVLIADTVWFLLGHPSELPYINRLGFNMRILLGVFVLLITLRNWQLLQYALAARRGYSEPANEYDDLAPWER